MGYDLLQRNVRLSETRQCILFLIAQQPDPARIRRHQGLVRIPDSEEGSTQGKTSCQLTC